MSGIQGKGNFFSKALAAGVARVLGRVTQMRHPGQSTLFGALLKRTRFDYAGSVGDGLDASVVTATVMWVQRALPEATLAMRERLGNGEIRPVERHDLLDLMANPNPSYSDILLLEAIVMSLLIDGNAYLVKIRNAMGKPVQLWFVPPQLMEPFTSIDGSAFVEYYRYIPGTGAGVEYYDPRDVVHIRHTLNPRNMIKGLSPLHGVMREIFTDLETSNFIASLLRNMGVPGTIISPKNSVTPSEGDIESTRTWFNQAFTGDSRGKALVFGGPMEVSSFGFNPEQMNLNHGSNRAEERVTACVGIPAAVVGFGAGLDQTKVGATMEELRKLAWHNGVLPLARKIVDELQRSLLPDFQRGQERGRRLELYWDTDHVLALQEDENKAIERKLKEYAAGTITLYEYRQETGRDADDSHRFFVRPIAQLIEPEGTVPGRQVIEGEFEEEEEAKSLPAPRKPAPEVKQQKNAVPEDWLPDDAQAATPEQIERGMALVTALRRADGAHRAAFQRALEPLFQSWAATTQAIAANVLAASGFAPKAGRVFETKNDDDLIQQIIDLLNLEAWEAQLSARYQQEYLGVARQVAETLEQSGFGTGLPDPVMREIISTGGRRAGLIDLDAQTREAIFDALTEGADAGEGIPALAKRIAGNVGGGVWGNAQTRARVIARTETAYARNISTLETGKAAGAVKFLVFDGIFGEPRSELSHIARNGKIVSAEQARIMADSMRPNCTLSFSPSF